MEAPCTTATLSAPASMFGGPAIVEERESTAVIGPGARCRVDDGLLSSWRCLPRDDLGSGARVMMDPVTLEVCWSRLIGVVNEQAAALQRTSFTSIVREAGRPLGRRLRPARLHGRPGGDRHPGPHQLHGAGHGSTSCAPTRSRPSSPATCSSPTIPGKTSGHLNDVTICSPVFRGNDCVAFFASTCHTADIGGHVLSAEAREVYEEGLQIPIMKLYEGRAAERVAPAAGPR